MFQCETCKKDSPALVAGECYACIRLDPDKEARLRQHFLIFDVDDPPDGYATFFDWLADHPEEPTNT